MARTQTLTVRLPAPMRAEIVRRAEQRGIPTGEAARDLIRTALDDDHAARRQATLMRQVLEQMEKRIALAVRCALDEPAS